MTFEEWFKLYGHNQVILNHKIYPELAAAPSVEQLYQLFKDRLISEGFVVNGKDKFQITPEGLTIADTSTKETG